MALRFEQLIERHHDEIFAYIWRLIGNDGRRDGSLDVEDLTQDVFLRAYESFEGLRPNSNHRAWLYKIATNCAYSQLRRMKHQRDKLSVRMLVNELPTKQKACVTLRYLQDLDYPEIAQILSCSQESARANVYQAIHRLRITLEKKHDQT